MAAQMEMKMTATTEAPANAPYDATLIRGKVYYLGEKIFEKNVAQPITQDEYEHLSVKAVDVVKFKGDDEPERRPKFKFTKRTRQRKGQAEGDE